VNRESEQNMKIRGPIEIGSRILYNSGIDAAKNSGVKG